MVKIDPLRPQKKASKRLVVGEIIGEGGMSIVRQAHDTNLVRSVAMKVIRAELARDEAMSRQFVEEAQINAQLDHPNIVPVHELGLDKKGSLYFTMKLVVGRTLAELLGEQDIYRRTEADLFQLLQIFLKVCDAVSFAHSRGVVHQDIKPENVMLGEHGEVYLMDWGISRLIQTPGSRASDPDTPAPKGRRYKASTEGIIQGTPFYMAPERARDERDAIDGRTDVFSLGGILYEILTLAPPYLDGSTREVMDQAKAVVIAPPQQVVDAPVPPWLADIAMKAMSRDPQDRFQSVIDMKKEIEAFLQSGWQYPQRVFEAGSSIVRQGDQGDEAFIILNGRCRVLKELDGNRTVLREMGAGEVFGETAILTGKPRAASVEAIDRVTVAVVAEKFFKEELGMGFWMGQFMKVLAERFREIDARRTELQHAQEESQLEIQALEHLARTGSDAPDGTRTASWADLSGRLQERFGLSPEALLSRMGRSDLVSIDTDRNTISLSG